MKFDPVGSECRGQKPGVHTGRIILLCVPLQSAIVFYAFVQQGDKLGTYLFKGHNRHPLQKERRIFLRLTKSYRHQHFTTQRTPLTATISGSPPYLPENGIAILKPTKPTAGNRI